MHGVNVAFGSHKATEDGQETEGLFVLANGHTAYRIDGVSGDLIWSWTAPDQTYVGDSVLAYL